MTFMAKDDDAPRLARQHDRLIGTILAEEEEKPRGEMVGLGREYVVDLVLAFKGWILGILGPVRAYFFFFF